MKFFEKYLPEKRRFRIFAILYFSLFLVLILTLFYRQIFQAEDFRAKERKQGQRRIIKPGARGDLFDREGNLLIGNRAHYSASIHLELLSREIWEEKIKFRRLSSKIREKLNAYPSLDLPQFLSICWQHEHVASRGISISGIAKHQEGNSFERAKVFLGRSRLPLNQTKSGKWTCLLSTWKNPSPQNLSFQNISSNVTVSVSGLFSIQFSLDSNGRVKSLSQTNAGKSWISRIFQSTNNGEYPFRVNGYNQSWEARLNVVQKYLQKVNDFTGRNKQITLSEIKSHWRKQLVLPLELSSNLTHQEYALLIENLPTDSPVQIHAKPIRHYPEKSLASHVLGYVGSGYKADTDELEGADLATFQLQGRTGKAGLEKTFDHILRGEDGYDIWIVNPMGSRFERIDRKAAQKGKSVQLSLDRDLQKIAEDSIERMVRTVAKRRILPDSNWEKTIRRRTEKALTGSDETEVRAELLIGAFKDAPFPLSGEQASTVAGFKGTVDDAEDLLRLLNAQGVLQKSSNQFDHYQLAPPPLPPGAAVLIDLQSGQILTLASKPNYDLSSLTPYISQAAYDDIQRREAWLPRAWA